MSTWVCPSCLAVKMIKSLKHDAPSVCYMYVLPKDIRGNMYKICRAFKSFEHALVVRMINIITFNMICVKRLLLIRGSWTLEVSSFRSLNACLGGKENCVCVCVCVYVCVCVCVCLYSCVHVRICRCCVLRFRYCWILGNLIFSDFVWKYCLYDNIKKNQRGHLYTCTCTCACTCVCITYHASVHTHMFTHRTYS